LADARVCDFKGRSNRCGFFRKETLSDAQVSKYRMSLRRPAALMGHFVKMPE
jgi:hypothetical protein